MKDTVKMNSSVRSVTLCITVVFLAISLRAVGTSPVENPTPEKQDMTKYPAIFTELSNGASRENNHLSDVSEETFERLSNQATLLRLYTEQRPSLPNILRSLKVKRETGATIPVLCMTQECIRILQDLLAKDSGILSGRWG